MVRAAVWVRLRRAEPEDERLPMERRQKVRGGDAGRGVEPVAFSLAVPVRHLVAAEQGRHPVVVERIPVACVLGCRPDRVAHPRRGRRPRLVRRLLRLLLGGEGLEEVGHAERAIGAVEGADQAVVVVQVSLDHRGPLVRQRASSRRLGITRDGPAGIAPAWIGQDRPSESTGGGSGGADHGDGLDDGHLLPLLDRVFL